MDYQFEMTPWEPTTVDKNIPISRNIIVKIQNMGDKKWIL